MRTIEVFPKGIEVIKEKFDKEAILWVVAFVGTCTLVALGKLKPEAVEMFLFAIIGRASSQRKVTE